jgi:ketosteroid isomerase-like protein
MGSVLALALVSTATAGAWLQQSSPATTPQQAVDELIAADRAFSKASAGTDLVSGLTAMFADDVAMLVPGSGFAGGAAVAAAALKANPDNAGARAEWTSIRGGISADGQNGFTFGYMTIRRADNTRVPAKYVAYWVKQPAGWRVAVYKRVRAGEGTPPLDMIPPSLPAGMVAPSSDAARTKGFRDSLDAAERAFSAEAQKIGIGPAFAKYGRADAVNVGPPTAPEFTRGADAIGRAVSGGSTSTNPGISWAPDRAIVASSGDLGVTMGMIRPNSPGPDGKLAGAVPFITIWRRPTPQDPWRYIAE